MVTPYSVTYDGNPHTATGTATGVNGESLSGLDLSGTTNTSAGITTDTWTFTDVTGNYQDASGTVSDVINKATLTVTGITANGRAYDGGTVAALNVGGAALHGVVGTEHVTLNTGGATGAFANKNVGTWTVQVSGLTITGTAIGNYTLAQPTTTANITAATINGRFTAAGKVYDGGTSATILTRSFTTTPFGTDNLTLVGGTASFADKNVNPVGTPKTVTGTGFTLGGTDAGNYHLASSTLTTTANITAATISGRFTAAGKVYNGGTSAAILTRTFTTTPFGTDNLTLVGGTASFADKNVNPVGTPKTVTGTGFTLGGTDAGNYHLASSTLTTTANITAATISGRFTAANKVYDGGTSAAILTRSFTTTPFGTDNLTLVGGTASFANKNVNPVGTPKTVTGTGFTLGGTDAGNYHLASSTLTTTANITAATISGRFTAAGKVYDGGTSAAILTRTFTTTPFGTDNLTLVGGTASFADKNVNPVGTPKTVTGTGFTLGGTDAGNYHLASNTLTTTANITARAVTVKADAKTKVFGHADPTLTYKVTTGSLVAGDSFSGSLTRVLVRVWVAIPFSKGP